MILKQKRVRKNQDIVTNGKIQIDEKVDEVFLDDERVYYEKYLLDLILVLDVVIQTLF